MTLFLLTGSIWSSETLTLTLQDSIDLALQQNPYHQAVEKKTDAAKSLVREAVAGFLPSLNGQGIKNLAEKVMELEFPSMIPGEPPQRIEVDFTRDYQFTLALNVPIFSGGRLRAGYRQARSNLQATEEMVRQSRHSTIFNTKQVFYGILLARAFVNVTEEAVADAQKLFNNVKIQYEVGLASKFDLLRSEVMVANLQPQLISARNSLKIMELNLKTILGLDLEKEIDVKGELSYTPKELNLDACLAKAMLHRPEIQQMKFQKNMARQGIKMARSTAFPTVAITGQYNFWADAFNFKSDNWTNFYAINLSLTIPIFNGFITSARVGQAKAALKELEFNQKGLEDMLRFEVSQAILNINEAKESLISQEKNMEQAQESLRIAELNYAEGMITLLDISQAQTALIQAKSNHTQALYDYTIALAELDKATGAEGGEV